MLGATQKDMMNLSETSADPTPSTFADLGLKPEILRAIEDVGYTKPTPIQAQAIPYVLQGRDLLGIAQTGTGKTAGFTLPMIEILANSRARARMPRALILEPTRELAAQVAENFELYGKYEKLPYALLIGGESFEEQIRKLDRGVNVLIATPGRMQDLFDRGKVLLADVKILVIDEADRMLDMGFIPDIERIVKLLPPLRQTLFFSATMPKEIRRLADAFLSNPREVSVAPQSTAAETVEQFAVPVQTEDKREGLRQLLRAEDVRNALIFCNRKKDVEVVFKSLTKHGFNVGQLHGDMVQSARTETLERFKTGDVQMLVCSDVAARGIDISDLSHVFNFDVPMHAEDYIHRIGRTGRAGRSGRAYTLVSPDDAKFHDAVEKMLKKPIPVFALDGLDAPSEEEMEAGRSGKRRRKAPAKPVRGSRDRADAAPARDGKAKPRRASARADKSADQSADAAAGKAADTSAGRPTARPTDKAVVERAEPVAASAAPAPSRRPAASMAPPAPVRDPRRQEGRDRRDRRDDDDHAVVGLGDHVPAFLLRPVPRLTGVTAGGETTDSSAPDTAPARQPRRRAASR